MNAVLSSYDKRVVSQLAALAQISRLSLFRRLIVGGYDGLTAGDLAQACQIGASSVSFHMKELLHAGLVRSEAQGRHVRYFAEIETMKLLLDFLTENCCSGLPCLGCEPANLFSFPSTSTPAIDP
jgi:ArsR family transcriptional regulator